MADWLVWYSQQIWWFSLGLAIGLPLGLILSKWRENEQHKSRDGRAKSPARDKVSEEMGDSRGSNVDTPATDIHITEELASSNTTSGSL